MKRRTLFLVLITLAICLFSYAHAENWILQYFVDDFGDYTDEKYLTTADRFHGKLSNSATTKADLEGYFIYSEHPNVAQFSLFLFEYGRTPVTNNGYYRDDYIVSIKDEDGTVYKFFGFVAREGGDRLYLFNSESELRHFTKMSDCKPAYFDEILSLFLKGQTLKFNISLKDSVTEYNFTIDTRGFAEVYENGFEKEIVYNDKNTIKEVQEALNNLGYDCGKPDGIAGSKTKEAIKAFQRNNSLDETGEVNRKLLSILRNDEIDTTEESIPEPTVFLEGTKIENEEEYNCFEYNNLAFYTPKTFIELSVPEDGIGITYGDEASGLVICIKHYPQVIQNKETDFEPLAASISEQIPGHSSLREKGVLTTDNASIVYYAESFNASGFSGYWYTFAKDDTIYCFYGIHILPEEVKQATTDIFKTIRFSV